MRREDESAMDALWALLMVAPAWAGPALAGLAYLVLRYLIPLVFFSGHPDQMATVGLGLFAALVRTSAPFVSGLILLFWVVAEATKVIGRCRMHSVSRDMFWSTRVLLSRALAMLMLP